MFDAVRNQKRIVQILLGLIALSFAVWGIGDYVRNVGGGGDVATVGNTKITQQDMQRALRDQQERLRTTLGPNYDPAMLERPEVRRAVLDSVVRQRLVQLAVSKSRLAVSDDQLREVIAAIPSLQTDGRFSMERYESALRGAGLTQAAFESQLRQDLAVQQIVAAVAESAFASRGEAARWLEVLLQEREVAEVDFTPGQYAAKMTIDAAAVKNYYEKNRNEFELPEQIRAAYVVFSQDKLADQVAVSDEEVKSYYAKNADRYKQPEERRASHILIQVAKDAKEADVKAAHDKIENILQQVKKKPADFARLAKEYSQDPGSAANGGDLGYFGAGAMVKPFEDAVASLKEGQISDIVRTDFGFHIIKLTGVHPAKAPSLDEIKPKLVAELKSQAAAKLFAENAENFSNMVYEQPDSLQPVADKFKLTIQQTSLFNKADRANAGPLNNERMMTALFSQDALQNKRNTEAIEVAPNTLVAARVIEHKPAALKPFDTVSGQIEARLKGEEAAKQAQKDGEARLAQLQKGEAADLGWSKPRMIQRGGTTENLSPDALRAIFRAPADKLPAYTGVRLPKGGYAVYRITKVTPVQVKDNDPRLTGQRSQLSQLGAERDFEGYVAELKQRYGVKINQEALLAKQ